MNVEILLLLGVAIFCGFFVQTLIGFAGSLVALPILLLGIKLPDAIAYISIFYIFSSGYLVYKEWENIDKNIILKLAWTSVIGVILGIIVLTYAKPVILQKALGVFIILYVAYLIFGKKEFQLGSKSGLLFGTLGGFFSGVFSTGGPLYVMAVKSTVGEVKVFRATMIAVLAVVTLVRVPTLAITGVLTFTHLKISLFILPVFFLAQFAGNRLFTKIDEHFFKKLLLGLLSLSGVALLF